MERSFSESLQDILDAIAAIESFTANADLESFQANREKSLAVVKLLEIVGEAVKKNTACNAQKLPRGAMEVRSWNERYLSA